MKVFIIIEAKSEDYHGTYKEVVGVFKDLDKAENEVSRLTEENGDYNTEHYLEAFNIQ